MEVSWHKIKNKMQTIKIIDVRDSHLYDLKHIKGSMNIPYQFLIINPDDYLDTKETYYLVCDYGIKSKMVSDILNKNGYRTHNIVGGINAYKKKFDKIDLDWLIILDDTSIIVMNQD